MSKELVTAQESAFELAQREAKALSSSALVPKIYQGTQGVANCLIAMNLAKRMGADPLMVMQSLNVIQGRPGFGASFLIASVNACGRFSALRFEFEGKIGDANYACRAHATEKETGEKLFGTWVTWAMAKAEGWIDKSGSKWKTMPEQMMHYRAASFWQRIYAPEISMGLLSSEEIADISPSQARIIPEETKALEELLLEEPEVVEGEEIPPPEDDPV